MFINVTTKENLEEFEDGSVELIDESKVGRLVKIHTIQVNQFDEKNKQIITGVQVLAEVYWLHDRSLSNVLMDVNNLAWVNFDSDKFAEDDETDQEDNEEHEETDDFDDESDDDSQYV